MRRALVVAALGLALAGAACSPNETDFADAAEEAIEGDLAERIALGDVEADCMDPDGTEEGTTFACTAETPAGDEIDVEAVIRGDDEVLVNATNVILASALDALEAEAARVLAEQVGQDLPAENVDCGSRTLVVDVGEPIVCALTDPVSNDIFDATVVFEDLSDGSFTVEVAATPRS